MAIVLGLAQPSGPGRSDIANSQIYETMLSRGIALFQEISSHEDEDDEDDSITAANIESWLSNKHQELVAELAAVHRHPQQVAAEITLDLGDTTSKAISPLQFARNLPKLAIEARKLCVCDDLRFHRFEPVQSYEHRHMT